MSYYWYLTNDNGTDKIGIVDSDEANYTGSATVFYSKLEEVDTSSDVNSPTINERWHWAIVYGALGLMGIPGLSEYYMSLYNKQVQEAKSSGRKTGTLVLWHY